MPLWTHKNKFDCANLGTFSDKGSSLHAPLFIHFLSSTTKHTRDERKHVREETGASVPWIRKGCEKANTIPDTGDVREPVGCTAYEPLSDFVHIVDNEPACLRYSAIFEILLNVPGCGSL